MTESLRKQAAHAVGRNNLWATHGLVCTDCESINVIALGDTPAQKVERGESISVTCHDCGEVTEQIDAKHYGN